MTNYGIKYQSDIQCILHIVGQRSWVVALIAILLFDQIIEVWISEEALYHVFNVLSKGLTKGVGHTFWGGTLNISQILYKPCG